GSILGTNGPLLWRQTLFIPPLPPNFGRGAGRPSTRRRKDVGDTEEKKKQRKGKQPMKMKRQKPTVTCKKCGVPGHNSRSCDKRKEQELEAQSQLTQEQNKSPLQRAFETILETKRKNAESYEKAKKRSAYGLKPNTNPTLLPPVIANEDEGEAVDLESLRPECEEYQIPKSANRAGPTPHQQLQMSQGKSQG
ncbi:zinc finger CCHC domain-containing protein 12, partial [Striga asiatica]